MGDGLPGPSSSGARGENAPWIEKYRPSKLDEVAAHTEIIATSEREAFAVARCAHRRCVEKSLISRPCPAVKRFMNEDRLPHLLFYGPPGTGKTSTILALAREMYGSRVGNMVLELNASDDRGIGVVRQEIQDFASTMLMVGRHRFRESALPALRRRAGSPRMRSSPQFAGKALKLVILDECDAMTKDAQFALRRVIEKYSRNTRFCLICNYASKIIPALQSRCTRFRFAPLPETFVRNRRGSSPGRAPGGAPRCGMTGLAVPRRRVEHVCQVEGVKIDGPGLDAVVRLGAGDMRRTLNILQSTAMAENDAGGAITERAVYSNTGGPA